MKNKKNTLWGFLFLAFVIVCALFLSWQGRQFLFGLFQNDRTAYFQGVLIFLICIWGSYLLYIPVHEAGHLVGGLLTGYRFCSFRIFHWMLVLVDGKLRLRRHSLPGSGGQCLMIPPALSRGTMPVMLYNLGGSALNLMVALLSLLLWWTLPHISPWQLLFLCSGFFHLIGALANGLPLPIGQIPNDGCNALHMLHKPQAVRAFWIQLQIHAMSVEGVRLKDMPEGWFYLPTNADLHNVLFAAIAVNHCNRLLDQLELKEADAQMAILLRRQELMPIYHNALQAERLFCELVGANRPEVIDRLYTPQLKTFLHKSRNNLSAQRIQYALALLHENDPNKAAGFLSRFHTIIKRAPHLGDVHTEQSLLALIPDSPTP